jgi:GMP synthase (glutamine-hydrolysing)
MLCRVIQHVSFEDLGLWNQVLLARGFEIVWHQSGINLPAEEEWLAADLGIVLGGPIGVNDQKQYPWLWNELGLVKSRIAAGRPLMGICLGAQLIAAALGAAVYPNSKKEIGWNVLQLSPKGLLSPLRHLRDVPVLHWHGDTFDLPKGAELLAATDLTKHQAFSLNSNTLALQFHPEADASSLERWLIGHTCELGHAGIDPSTVRAENERFGQILRAKSVLVFEEWLDGLMVKNSRR